MGSSCSWLPDLDQMAGPLYWRIAKALSRDIQSGRLSVGERLPPHRALAEALGVTVNTVTKAYAEVERIGLIVSRTGRGTYVKGFPEELADGSAEKKDVIDLKANVVTGGAFNPVFNKLLGTLSRRGSLHGLLEYHPHPGLERHRAAGARWIAQRGIDARADQVILCNGAQEGLMAALSAVTRPHDTLLTEKLSYAGLRYIAEVLRLNIRGIDIDEEGMIPDKLEAACRNESVAAIFVNPTNHNPTNAFMPLDRRRALVEIAERAGALVVEDDIFGHVSGYEAPLVTSLAPDRCIYVCGTSKSIAAGLRVGYVLAPPALVKPIIDALRATYLASPALMAEITTLLIEDGHANEFAAWHRQESRARQALAREALGLDTGIALPSYHLWLPLPEPWRGPDFATELKAKGVLVAPCDQFAVDRSPLPHAVRLALGAVGGHGRLQEGLGIIAQTLTDRSNRLRGNR
ncbi:MAG: PLP-dependent aminotransferase family protein [Kiloniellales bacterium]|nr:PLP-dependent aminotransferase family protein [Kiloniellales bacterium]